MDLVWGVVALTVATFTVLLAVRRVAMAVSGLVFARYVAVGGLAAFTVHRDAVADDTYRVRFEVGGPAVFHNVTVQLFGRPEGAAPPPPALRHTMIAGDDPIDWTFRLPDAAAAQTWVVVTWVRPYLQGVESEALAHWLQAGRLCTNGVGTQRRTATCGRSCDSSLDGGPWAGSHRASCRCTGGGGVPRRTTAPICWARRPPRHREPKTPAHRMRAGRRPGPDQMGLAWLCVPM